MLYVFVFLYCKDTAYVTTYQTDNSYTLIDSIYQTSSKVIKPLLKY